MIKCYKEYRKINTISIYLFLIKNLRYIEFDFKLNSLEWNNKSFWFNKYYNNKIYNNKIYYYSIVQLSTNIY